jgi:hypothetical protein
MDNNKNNENNENNMTKIKELYDNLSYFDQYGSSVILLILITIVLFVLCSYCFVLININPIRDDWVNQRCKPSVMPFAGLINTPDGMTPTEFTKQNFDYCTQNIIKGVTGEAVQPLTFITTMLSKIFESVDDSINNIREMFNKIRTQIRAVAEEIMGRIINMTIPLQQIIIGLKDILSKVQGVMTAGLFTLLGSYYTLQSLMGAIAQFIISILIVLAVLIASLWIVPFTWGAAAANTSIFMAISIPMAIILTFMIEVLGVKPDSSIPLIKCFDKNTVLKMNDGTEKLISNIVVGDVLFDNNEVTSTIQVSTIGSQMYNLNGIIVSDSHIVNYKENWLPVSKHPEAIHLTSYDEPFLYCLNTNTKFINIKDHIFTDWDEIYEDNNYKVFQSVLIKNNKLSKHDVFKSDYIHKYFNSGFVHNTVIPLIDGSKKEITDVKVGDILIGGEKVYGLVELNGKNTSDQYAYNLGINETFVGGANLIFYNKNKIISTLDLDDLNKNPTIKNDKLYHLLTDKGTFIVNQTVFLDYNAAIDYFMKKNK